MTTETNDDWTMYEMACLNPVHGRPLHYVMTLGGAHETAVCPICERADYSKFVCGDGSFSSDPQR